MPIPAFEDIDISDLLPVEQDAVRYNPNQPRDGNGRWIAGAGGVALTRSEMIRKLAQDEHPDADPDLVIDIAHSRAMQKHTDLQTAPAQAEYTASLDDLEHDAIREYTGNGYSATNRYLRGAPPPPVEEGSEEYDIAVSIADIAGTAVSDAPPLGVDTTLYRGFGAAGGAQFEGLQVGSVIRDDGIISTSVSATNGSLFMGIGDQEIGGVMRIKAPAATRGLPVGKNNGLSSVSSELEVILPPSTNFRVTGIDGNLIDVEVVVE